MRGNSVPPPPAAFATVNIATISAGSVLHRTHATASGPGQFNPCLRQPFSRQSESPDRSGTLLSIGRRDACDSGASRLALADNVGNRHLLGNELEFEKGVGDVLLLRDNGVIQVLDPV